MEALVHEVVEHVNIRAVLDEQSLERDHALQPQVLALRVQREKAWMGKERAKRKGGGTAAS